MRSWLWRCLLAAALLAPAARTGGGAAPDVVSATCLGTAGDDRIEGVAIADDGSIYLAGNTAAPPEDLPGAVRPVTLGRPVEGWTYGCAFVARLSPDGTRLLGYLAFAPGVAKFTTVEVNARGVYVGGYGSPGLEPLLGPLGGLFPKAHGFEQRTLKTYNTGEHYSEPQRDPKNDQRGVPCVLRMPADLKRLDAGTFLEGWQSCWHVPWPLGEDHWQPTGIGLLAGGDVVVSHDGGYNLMPRPGEQAGFEHFYGVPDHVSRLSADLARRAWKIDVFTPPVDPEKVNRYQANFGRSRWSGAWTLDTLGNTRIFRLRVAPDDAFYVAGWSPTRTSHEPWWSSFLWKLGPDGKLIWRAYNPDPMSGGGDRMGGQVSDAAIRTVALDDRGDVLASLIGDGGNNILRFDPRDYARPAPRLKGMVSGFKGRVLFWGGVVRLDRETREVLGGNHISGTPRSGRDQGLQAAWANDMAPLPGGRVLAVGRNTEGFPTSEDAWHRDLVGGFLRIYSSDFDLEFSTSLPDVDPLTVACRGSRAAIVGVARPLPGPRGSWGRRPRPEPGGERPPVPPSRSALVPAPQGGHDGYVMVIDCGR